ncbi:hypothetical protein D9M68_723080 [compost metagenome]|uniref:hypothetical protein n=1 Tax=Variovorax boronicumulans TaxID=436515 RepID=UPI000F90916B
MTKLPAAARPRSPVPVRSTLNIGDSGVYLVTSLTGLMTVVQMPGPHSQIVTYSGSTGVPSTKLGSQSSPLGPQK